MVRQFNPHVAQERDRRSQIGSQETGRELTPTVPGGHAKGSNCAARKRASSQRPSLRRRARRPLVKIRSAAIAGHEWTVSFHAEGSEHRLIPEPRLEGGISGVRGMPRDPRHQVTEEHRPELTDAWGVTFRGRADAATGHVWWWTRDDGRRIPLRPANPKTNLDMKECRKR